MVIALGREAAHSSGHERIAVIAVPRQMLCIETLRWMQAGAALRKKS